MPTPRADESDAVMEDGIGQHDKALHPLCDFEFTFESSMLMIEPDVRYHLSPDQEAFTLT
ncbi:hypothetical protein J3458_021360 [Metarhizium acridum]|uniref:uncharacterized protein n=1 Tax=Metarhizium acridum TaxID=92637 RepID=UPI001C6ACAEE|nr:hypothetical protein J3458_021360 [Metarhizium acridum]